ncbi:MAG: hypothetical protein HYR85_02935 [Planctomycetes bacterium]|nr:hypothetical protein [Planctomycetota bacterium]MBI3844425.1 hypothetical protein [Planctomycetota bacterium]
MLFFECLLGAPPPDGTEPSPPTHEVGSVDVQAEVEVGWRLVSVHGSEAAFDEDQNLDSSLLLRAFTLRATPHEGEASPAFDRFELSGAGVGDPWSSFRLDTQGSGVHALGRWDESRFTVSGNESDLHSFDFDRQRGSLRFEPADPRGGWRTGIDLEYGHRDGFGVSTHDVDILHFVSGVPVKLDEETKGVHGDLAGPIAGFDARFDAGIEDLDANQRRAFTAPSPVDPMATQTEDFGAKGRGTSAVASTRWRRAFGTSGLSTDFGIDWQRAHVDWNGTDRESGIFFTIDDTFERLTREDTRGRERSFEADWGWRWQLAREFALRTRFTRTDEVEHASVAHDIFLTEMDVPLPEQLLHEGSIDESRLGLVEAGLEATPLPWAELDVSVEYARERALIQRTFEDQVLESLHQTVEHRGVEGSLDCELGRDFDLVLASGYRIAPTNTPVTSLNFTFEDERGTSESAQLRWRPAPGWSGSLGARHRENVVHELGRRASTDSATLALAASPSEEWSAAVSGSLRHYDLSADTIMIVLDPFPTVFPTQVDFSGTEAVVTGSCSYQVAPGFRPAASASVVTSRGDATFDFESLALDVPASLGRGWSGGVELRFWHFDGGKFEANASYDALAATVYVKVAL